MSNWKKVFAALTLAAVLACALTACGGPKMTGYLLDGQRELAEGETTTITVAGDYGDQVVEDDKKEAVAMETLSWTSSNEAVAIVKDGVVTAVGAGDVTISATSADEKLTGSLDIQVVAVREIAAALDESELALNEGETAQLAVTAEPERNDYTTTWSSSDEKVATVDETGKVTAVGAGKAEIRVTVRKDDVEDTATASVTVEAVKPTPAPEAKPAKAAKSAKAEKPSQPAQNNKPADKPSAPAKPEQPAPAPQQPVTPPAPAPEQPAPVPSLAPDEQPFVSLPVWGDDNVNMVPFD